MGKTLWSFGHSECNRVKDLTLKRDNSDKVAGSELSQLSQLILISAVFLFFLFFSQISLNAYPKKLNIGTLKAIYFPFVPNG